MLAKMVSVLSTRFTSLLPYHQSVFHCNDPAFQFPLQRGQDAMVHIPENCLYIICFLIPILVIAIGELCYWMFSTRPVKTTYAHCGCCKIHNFTRRTLKFTAVFLFGAFAVCIFTDTAKIIAGRPRPCFSAVCQPDRTVCPLSGNHQLSPLTNPALACANTEPDELRMAWTSFPSLHASLSFYTAAFISCYLHYMIHLRGVPLLKPFFISGAFMLAVLVSLARLQIYRNHLEDLVAGSILGAGFAFYLVFNVLRFQESKRACEPVEKTILPDNTKPIFSWFKLPRANLDSPNLGRHVESESSYDMGSLDQNVQPRIKVEVLPPSPRPQDYEMTTTIESFEIIIQPNIRGLNLERHLI